MSGILGIFNLDGKPVDCELLAGMAAAMEFRGPDATDQWISGGVGMAHALFRSAEDSEDEHQPLQDETGQFCLIFDGRIDDRAAITDALKSRGFSLSTRSDAELVLRAYQAWGEECTTKLIGEFAFGIWDGRRRHLFCARDHLGCKPFFYARTRNIFLFGNTLQALRLHPEVADELNERHIGDFLLFSVQQDATTTVYRDVVRLPPSHSLTVSSTKFHLNKYWQLPDVPELRYKRTEDYVHHFRGLLGLAVADRLRASRVSVLMSGGLDSPCVAATAQQLMTHQGRGNGLRALCVHYEGMFADPEKRFAEIAAGHLTIPLEFLDASKARLYCSQFQPPEPVDRPLPEVFAQELRALSRWGRVVLTGHDADTLLEANLALYIRLQLHAGSVLRLAKECAYTAVLERSIPVLKFFSIVRRRRAYDLFALYPKWLNPDFERRCELRERWRTVESAWIDSVHTGISRMTTNAIWPAMLESYDPGQTGVPVEYRHPMTDLRLMNFCLALSPIPWCVRKRLIRVAMNGILPKAIVKRPKTPLVGEPAACALSRDGVAHLPSLQPADAYVRIAAIQNPPPNFNNPDESALYLRPYSLSSWLAGAMEGQK